MPKHPVAFAVLFAIAAPVGAQDSAPFESEEQGFRIAPPSDRWRFTPDTAPDGSFVLVLQRRAEHGPVGGRVQVAADAETHAREGLSHLEQTGPWTDELPENVVKGVAHALLAEILRRIADEDDVIFGDPDRFRQLVEESKQHFETASRLDSDDSYSSYYAFFLGEAGH